MRWSVVALASALAIVAALGLHIILGRCVAPRRRIGMLVVFFVTVLGGAQGAH